MHAESVYFQQTSPDQICKKYLEEMHVKRWHNWIYLCIFFFNFLKATPSISFKLAKISIRKLNLLIANREDKMFNKKNL